MKIKWKQVEIECTVDEFEVMVARDWFGLKSLKEAFEEENPFLTIPTENDKVWPQIKDHTITCMTDTPPDEYSQILPHPVPIHPKQTKEVF